MHACLVTCYVQLFATLWTLVCLPGSSVHGIFFFRREYWSGLPFPSLGELPDPGIKPWSPTLQVDCLLSEPLVIVVWVK